MILFLYGEDTFRCRRYLDQSVEKFKRERDPGGYNVIRLDGKKTEPSRIFAEMASAPFLAAKRMVVVENVLGSSDKVFLSELQEKIKSNRVPESNVVILVQSEPVGKTKEAKALFEVLKKEQFVQEFTTLPPDKLVGWIKKEVAEVNSTITDEAAAYIAVNCAGDLWLAASVIAQLVAYTRGTKVEHSVVKQFLSEKLDDNVFTMIEALVSGRRELAVKLLYVQRQLGQDDFQIFNLILWQMRTLLSIRSLLEDQPGIPPENIAQKIGLHPFVVKKNSAIVRRYTVEQLTRVVEQLQSIDIKTKTGQAEQGLLLDMLVAQMA